MNENLSPQARLETWRERPEITGVRIVGPPPLSSCQVCRRAAGKTLSLKEALAAQPLPHEECQLGDGCCCTYAPAFEEMGQLAHPAPAARVGVVFCSGQEGRAKGSSRPRKYPEQGREARQLTFRHVWNMCFKRVSLIFPSRA